METEGFLKIEKIVIPFYCLSQAYNHLREAGEKRVEGVALFAGKENGNVFMIEETIIPEQKAMRLSEGLLYAVDGEELHRINVWLYENSMSLMVQIHSHPGEAYHSVTDDTYPIVATVGSVSIVVPDFASGPVEISFWKIYRLSQHNEWISLDENEKSRLLEIVK
jgi:hypothetical protein